MMQHSNFTTTLLRNFIMAVLFAAAIYVVHPFFGILTWAIIITISVRPVIEYVRQHSGFSIRFLAISLVIGSLLTIALPLIVLALSALQSVPKASNFMIQLSQFSLPDAPVWLSKIPIVGTNVINLWHTAQTDLPSLMAQIHPYINDVVLWILGGGASIGLGITQMLAAIVLSGILLCYTDPLTHQLNLIFKRLAGNEVAEHLVSLMATTVRSVTVAIIGTAIIQGLLCLIGFWITGIEGALLLGFICCLLAIAQIPPILILLPVSGYLFFMNQQWQSIFLAIYGIVIISNVDNILKPLLMRGSNETPLPLIFIGVIGGMLAWGLIGLFIGPIVLALCYALTVYWLGEKAAEEKINMSNQPPLTTTSIDTINN
ncbi:MAG: AI-2E family transporter [Neisseriaceae bacterium]|nr:AI-2E family transporter [Neisseriaceae bacterium]